MRRGHDGQVDLLDRRGGRGEGEGGREQDAVGDRQAAREAARAPDAPPVDAGHARAGAARGAH